jgi:anti-sigma-K factor RskA
VNDHRCSEVDDLLVGYAADALDEDERCAVASHLAECRNHDTELVAIRADFESLVVAVAPIEPPAALRSSLLSAFDQEIAGGAPQPPAEPTPIRPAARPARPRLLSNAGLGYALAAALLVIAAGLGAWGLSRGGDDSGVILATASEDGHSLQITYVKGEHLAVLAVDLAALPEGETYQAWQIVNGAPVSVGVLDTHSGRVAFTADLDNATAIALSVEPLGGSQSPTTTPILVTELPRS